MNCKRVMMSRDAGGDLPASPCIRFSKEGELLAVSTRVNGIKILANAEGIRLMRSIRNRAGATSEAPVIGTSGASGSAAGSSMGADKSFTSAPVTTPITDGGVHARTYTTVCIPITVLLFLGLEIHCW